MTDQSMLTVVAAVLGSYLVYEAWMILATATWRWQARWRVHRRQAAYRHELERQVLEFLPPPN